jgi:hypothetical protein
MKRIVILIAAGMLIPQSAFAWKHLYKVWSPSQIPVPYTISEVGEDSLPNPGPDAEEAVVEGYAAWLAAECSTFEAQYDGLTADNTPNILNELNHVSFDDPGGDLGATVKAVTNTIASAAIVFNQDGNTYFKYRDTDIIFNDGFDWATDAQIDSGDCFNEHSIQSTATHEIGHLMGLGHSCEEGEACTELSKLEATMFWSAGACNTQRSQINEDDIDGITAIYGPYATFQCSRELTPGDADTTAFGVVPFTLNCSVVSKNIEEIQSVEWFWGDGESATGNNVSHEFTRPGNYTVSALITGENQACGVWDYNHRRVSYVRACDVPSAESSYSHVDGLTYQLLNETDVSVYGCIYNIQWDVYKEGSSEVLESIQAWEPQFTFPEEGTYRVVLNVGGPAGIGAAEIMIDAKKKRGEGYGGCNVAAIAAPAGLGSFLLLTLGAIGIRRRR